MRPSSSRPRGWRRRIGWGNSPLPVVYEPMGTPTTKTEAATRAYVVGADHSFVLNSFSGKLRDVGIEMVGHYPRDKNAGGLVSIPSEAQVVIIIKNPIGHDLQMNAVKAAKKADLPVVHVPRRFSKARPLLEQAGLITPEDDPIMDAESSGEVLFTTLKEHIALVQKAGRVPSRSELLGVARRFCGQKADVTDNLWSRLQREAARMQAQTAAASAPPAPEPEVNNLLTYAELLIEDKPEVWQPIEELRDLAETNADEDTLRTVLIEARSNWKQRIDSDRAFAHQSMDAWMQRHFAALGIQSEGDMPSYRNIQTDAKGIFGFKPTNNRVRDQRRIYLASLEKSPVPLDITPTLPTVNGGSYKAETILERVVQGVAVFNSLTSPERALIRDWFSSGENLEEVRQVMEPGRSNPPVAITLMMCAHLPWEDDHPHTWTFCTRYKDLFGKGTAQPVARVVAQSLGIPLKDANSDIPITPPVAHSAPTEGYDSTLAAVLEAATGVVEDEEVPVVGSRGLLRLQGNNPLGRDLTKQVGETQAQLKLMQEGLGKMTQLIDILEARLQDVEAENVRLSGELAGMRVGHVSQDIEAVKIETNGRIDGIVRRLGALEGRMSQADDRGKQIVQDLIDQSLHPVAIRLAETERALGEVGELVSTDDHDALVRRVASLETGFEQTTVTGQPAAQAGEYTLRELMATGRSIQIGAAPTKKD